MSDELEFNDKDKDDFVNFIVEKSKNVTAPFNHRKLCSEFKEESGAQHLEEYIMEQLREVRMLIFKWDEYFTHDFDKDTKVKMLFALGAPVDYSLLQKLREDAVVEVDKYLRITKYEKKEEDGLKLNGVHSSHAPRYPYESDREAMQLLAERSQVINTQISDDEFLKFFATSDSTLDTSYEYVKNHIHIATQYDMPTRIKMLFVSGAEVDAFFLGMLRKDAIVIVDEEGRITNYKANDGIEYQTEFDRRE